MLMISGYDPDWRSSPFRPIPGYHPPAPALAPDNRGEDLTGQKFGELTVVRRHVPPSGRASKSGSSWDCACSCGRECAKPGSALKRGEAKSCGHLAATTRFDGVRGREFAKLGAPLGAKARDASPIRHRLSHEQAVAFGKISAQRRQEKQRCGQG